MVKDYHNLTDNELIAKLTSNDKIAFETLFKRYYSRLCEFSCMVVNNHDQAKDIVQDVFLSLWQNRNIIQITSLKSYLFQAVKNNSVNTINKKIQHNQMIIDHLQGDNISYIEDFELKEKINQSLGELPTRCREIFVLSRFNKMSHNEIAEKLNLSPKTVEVQIRKANILLRNKLKNFAPFLIFYLLNKGF